MRVVTLSLMACVQQLFSAVGCEMRLHLFETKLGQTETDREVVPMFTVFICIYCK